MFFWMFFFSSVLKFTGPIQHAHGWGPVAAGTEKRDPVIAEFSKINCGWVRVNMGSQCAILPYNSYFSNIFVNSCLILSYYLYFDNIRAMPGILVPYYSNINDILEFLIILRCPMGSLMSTPSRSQPIFLLDVVRHPMVKMAVTFLYQPGFLENLTKVFKTKKEKW